MPFEKVTGSKKDLKFAGVGPREAIRLAREKAKMSRRKKRAKQKGKDTETAKKILELERIKREMRLKKLIENAK